MKCSSDMPPEVLQAMAAVFKALAHPGRLRMVNSLRRQPMSICELAAETSQHQGEVSKHAHLLAQVHLMSLARRGNRVICRINAPLVRQLWGLAGLTNLTPGPPAATLKHPFDPEI